MSKPQTTPDPDDRTLAAQVGQELAQFAREWDAMAAASRQAARSASQQPQPAPSPAQPAGGARRDEAAAAPTCGAGTS